MNNVFREIMTFKKILIILFFISTLAGCAQSTALLGPIYTFGTTGNTLQAGLSYGSNEAITMLTGKTAGENVKEIFQANKRDAELRKLLKRRITESRKKLNLTKLSLKD